MKLSLLPAGRSGSRPSLVWKFMGSVNPRTPLETAPSFTLCEAEMLRWMWRNCGYPGFPVIWTSAVKNLIAAPLAMTYNISSAGRSTSADFHDVTVRYVALRPSRCVMRAHGSSLKTLAMIWRSKLSVRGYVVMAKSGLSSSRRFGPQAAV